MHHWLPHGQPLGHPPGQVDRNRKTQASAWACPHQGVQADHLTCVIYQGTAGIAGVDGGIGLN